ncbi:unnamed protein product [Prunus armeniaca]
MAQVEKDASDFDSCFKDFWGSAAQMYYDASDESQIYELQCKATCITQGGRNIASYFAELKSVWLKLDRRCPINMKYPDDVKIQHAEIQKDCIYDFLIGLDDEFDKIRGYLLRLRPLPKLKELFAFIR